MSSKIVISASRRTDIPAFYMDWFMDRIDKSFFETVNPYNQKKTIVHATPDHVHTIVFWSKDFSRFIDGGFGEQLKKKGYNLFFNFTINSEDSILEPNIPPLESRIEQAEALCEAFGPQTVTWRFDPMCFYTLPDGSEGNNLKSFPKIADHMASMGILRCITSFMDHYSKIDKRSKPFAGFHFLDPNIKKKVRILQKMKSIIASKHMKLYTCCEKKVLSAMPPEANVQNSSCIPNRLLKDLFGGKLSFKKDTGQRIKQGCGCMVSTDIGLYKQQPCYHNCLFCYANPASRKHK
ncbi:MAG: DUF1848 domain-containing protein [Desulfobacteraceae bacterium]|nr:DUF1848 family protein [Desulfobacteraceae bacterium]MBC2758135.1 DUF1848 domain-containing protein [Desulfobacteraceae bacterium]